jgi:pimeloyl-ACP methyl ester carboxylesterase
MPRTPILLAIAWLLLISGCARPPATGVTSLKPASLSELREYLLTHKADLDLFRLRGPFAVSVQTDRELRLSPAESISVDLYLSAPTESAPLVILLHGSESTKEAHAHQALHLASWGMHSIAVQLSNTGPWIANGRILARLVGAINREPAIVDRRIDPGKIILAGHSFGGAAATIALAEGAPAAGSILLDPAGTGKQLPNFLKQVNKPVMLIGADEKVSATVDRGYFFRFIPAGITEVSIKDAAHEDGQYPSERSLQKLGIDPYTTEELQITFVSALTSAAFSLAYTGKFDYAWASFSSAVENGKFFNAKRK